MSDDETIESEEYEEASPGSVLAKGKMSLPQNVDVSIEIPIEAQAGISKIVEDLVVKEVDRKLPSLINERTHSNELKDRERYWTIFYMTAGLSAFAGLLGFAYFGGNLGLLLVAASVGPFLMSLLGLYRTRHVEGTTDESA